MSMVRLAFKKKFSPHGGIYTILMTLFLCGILTACRTDSLISPDSPSQTGESDHPASLTLRESSLEIGKGLSAALHVETGEISAWRSSDASIASVTEDGTVTGINVGSCVITAVSENGTVADCTVAVKKTCYLTFDDGPNERTPELLAVLEEYDAKATFFVVSSYYLEYTRNIEEQGSVVGLHTYSHNYESCYRSTFSYYYGLEQMARRVEAFTGSRPTLIRFPGGTHNAVSDPLIMQRIANGAKDLGYRAFDWTATSGDTSTKNASADFSVYCVKRDCVHDVEILLMHEKAFNIPALRTILPYLREQGYVFETLDHYPEDSFTFATRYSRKNALIPSTSISVTRSEANLQVGDCLTLGAHIYPSNSTDYTRWESSDPSVAEVLPNGDVTAMAPGETEIAAITSSGQKAICRITVL
ncbi:MAG: polysaccharide deacetylase family protein [Clostridia bacterium]|nr:polysaccharide deacetylase family protein [Clostridia bacterium]